MAIFAVITLLLAACGAETPPTPTLQPTASPTPARPYLVLGDISSDDPAGATEEAQPLADYLAAQLVDYGITEGRVRIASSIDEMADLVANGEVDLYFDSVYPATAVSDKTGAQMFIRRWKSGVAEYHTVIFTTTTSGIMSLADLPGHTFGVEDDYSTSGYMLPLAHLRMNGLNVMAGTGDAGETVPSDQIAYVFTGGDEDTVQWVLDGRVDAGGVEDGTFDEIDPLDRDQLVVLAESESLPRHVGVARPGIDPALLQALTDLLLNADQTDGGRQALQAFSETTRFDEFPQGLEAATERIRELVGLVQNAS